MDRTPARVDGSTSHHLVPRDIGAGVVSEFRSKFARQLAQKIISRFPVATERDIDVLEAWEDEEGRLPTRP